MHAIQGAVAIRRERQKRQQRRASQLKRASQGEDDFSIASQVSLFQGENPNIPKAPKAESSLTAFHLGVVFILFGFLMILSSMISSNVIDTDWSRLLGVGIVFIFIGLLMVMVNRILTQKEEEELSKYVHNRLGRTRSGYAIGRYLEVNEDARIPRQQRRRDSHKSSLRKHSRHGESFRRKSENHSRRPSQMSSISHANEKAVEVKEEIEENIPKRMSLIEKRNRATTTVTITPPENADPSISNVTP